MQKIHATTETSPYATVLANFLAQEFPGSVSNAEAVFEAVCSEVFGTKQHRYGPMPSVEQQVAVREIIRSYMDSGDPIEVLVPWGSSKQADVNLDVLELSALRSIHCLSERVKRHYAPGIRVSIRVEDATDMVLFDPSFYGKINTYAVTMVKLVQALGYKEITVKRETELMSTPDFHEHVRDLTPWIAEYMNAADRIGSEKAMETDAYQTMKRLGWKGNIPLEQRSYYKRSYRIFYPDKTEEEINESASVYFACSLVRRLMNGTGAPVGQHIQLCYNLPVPGIPWKMAANRLYYRTVPERFTNRHKAPWIGRGYIEIASDNSCKIKLADFNQPPDGLQPFCFAIGDADVNAPYILT
jgi:hypothetical protein